jgi:hypothetical protein
VNNESGNYAAPFVVPGVYNVHAERSGFKAAARQPVIARSSADSGGRRR